MKQFNLKEYLENPSRKVITRDGRDVRILCTDRKDVDGYCVIGLVTDGRSNEQWIRSWTENGYWDMNGNETDADLCFAPEKHEGWICVYDACNKAKYVDGIVYSTEELAKLSAIKTDNKVVAITKIEWEE